MIQHECLKLRRTSPDTLVLHASNDASIVLASKSPSYIDSLLTTLNHPTFDFMRLSTSSIIVLLLGAKRDENHMCGSVIPLSILDYACQQSMSETSVMNFCRIVSSCYRQFHWYCGFNPAGETDAATFELVSKNTIDLLRKKLMDFRSFSLKNNSRDGSPAAAVEEATYRHSVLQVTHELNDSWQSALRTLGFDYNRDQPDAAAVMKVTDMVISLSQPGNLARSLDENIRADAALIMEARLCLASLATSMPLRRDDANRRSSTPTSADKIVLSPQQLWPLLVLCEIFNAPVAFQLVARQLHSQLCPTGCCCHLPGVRSTRALPQALLKAFPDIEQTEHVTLAANVTEYFRDFKSAWTGVDGGGSPMFMLSAGSPSAEESSSARGPRPEESSYVTASFVTAHVTPRSITAAASPHSLLRFLRPVEEDEETVGGDWIGETGGSGSGLLQETKKKFPQSRKEMQKSDFLLESDTNVSHTEDEILYEMDDRDKDAGYDYGYDAAHSLSTGATAFVSATPVTSSVRSRQRQTDIDGSTAEAQNVRPNVNLNFNMSQEDRAQLSSPSRGAVSKVQNPALGKSASSSAGKKAQNPTLPVESERDNERKKATTHTPTPGVSGNVFSSGSKSSTPTPVGGRSLSTTALLPPLGFDPQEARMRALHRLRQAASARRRSKMDGDKARNRGDDDESYEGDSKRAEDEDDTRRNPRIPVTTKLSPSRLKKETRGETGAASIATSGIPKIPGDFSRSGYPARPAPFPADRSPRVQGPYEPLGDTSLSLPRDDSVASLGVRINGSGSNSNSSCSSSGVVPTETSGTDRGTGRRDDAQARALRRLREKKMRDSHKALTQAQQADAQASQRKLRRDEKIARLIARQDFDSTYFNKSSSHRRLPEASGTQSEQGVVSFEDGEGGEGVYASSMPTGGHGNSSSSSSGHNGSHGSYRGQGELVASAAGEAEKSDDQIIAFLQARREEVYCDEEIDGDSLADANQEAHYHYHQHHHHSLSHSNYSHSDDGSCLDDDSVEMERRRRRPPAPHSPLSALPPFAAGTKARPADLSSPMEASSAGIGGDELLRQKEWAGGLHPFHSSASPPSSPSHAHSFVGVEEARANRDEEFPLTIRVCRAWGLKECLGGTNPYVVLSWHSASSPPAEEGELGEDEDTGNAMRVFGHAATHAVMGTTEPVFNASLLFRSPIRREHATAATFPTAQGLAPHTFEVAGDAFISGALEESCISVKVFSRNASISDELIGEASIDANEFVAMSLPSRNDATDSNSPLAPESIGVVATVSLTAAPFAYGADGRGIVDGGDEEVAGYGDEEALCVGYVELALVL